MPASAVAGIGVELANADVPRRCDSALNTPEMLGYVPPPVSKIVFWFPSKEKTITDAFPELPASSIAATSMLYHQPGES
jgi:hypothetical protein